MVLSLWLVWGWSQAQEATPSEYQVKAAFIFNFIKFVEWPAAAFTDTNAPLTIGVFGKNPFEDHLQLATQNKLVNNRPVAVKACPSLADARQCHVVFVSNSEKSRLTTVVEGLTGAAVLTIADTEGFIKYGGMINFFRDGNKFRFEINDAAARKAGLKISSKLLSLASRPAN